MLTTGKYYYCSFWEFVLWAVVGICFCRKYFIRFLLGWSQCANKCREYEAPHRIAMQSLNAMAIWGGPYATILHETKSQLILHGDWNHWPGICGCNNIRTVISGCHCSVKLTAKSESVEWSNPAVAAIDALLFHGLCCCILHMCNHHKITAPTSAAVSFTHISIAVNLTIFIYKIKLSSVKINTEPVDCCKWVWEINLLSWPGPIFHAPNHTHQFGCFKITSLNQDLSRMDHKCQNCQQQPKSMHKVKKKHWPHQTFLTEIELCFIMIYKVMTLSKFLSRSNLQVLCF